MKRLAITLAVAAGLAASVVPASASEPRWNCGNGPECYAFAVVCLTLPERYRPVCELG